MKTFHQIHHGEKLLPNWMTYGKTVLCQRDLAIDNNILIPCLPLLSKLMTEMFAEKMFSHLVRENVLPSEQKQKEYREGSPETKDQLLTGKTVLTLS